MRKPIALCLSVAFAFCVGQRLLADERVARIVITKMPSSGLPDLPILGFGNNNEFLLISEKYGDEFGRRSFVVYTKEEIDAKQAQDAQLIRELQDQIMLLKKNLKDLADANDALGKRLEGFETKNFRSPTHER